MSKSPSFQFYAENFLSGSAEFTCEEVGAYIRLLCHQWHKGGLPNDDKKLMSLTGAKIAAIKEVRSKFALGEDGLLRNERLEKSRQELTEFKKSKSEAGKEGNKKRWEAYRKSIAELSHSEDFATRKPVANYRSSSSSSKEESIESDSDIGNLALAKNNEIDENEEPEWVKRDRQQMIENLKQDFSLKAIQAYFEEKKYPALEAEKFYNYYSARGWKIGKTDISNWKSLAGNWMLRVSEFEVKNPTVTKENTKSTTPKFYNGSEEIF